ncbi:MAG: PilZ domain-containing protein [Phycisphaerales bacterium]|nr:PilZ domain-containing protein [Phycisphaerales bacterium]
MSTTPSDNPLRQDRRLHPRIPVSRPARLLRGDRPASPGLAFARTTDISTGGALIEIAATRPFNIGESVRVAVLSDSAVIDPRSMEEATVVRAQPAGPGRQRVAVRFAQQIALPLVA